VAPKHLTFNPYKVGEIVEIIKGRLLTLTEDGPLTPSKKNSFVDQNISANILSGSAKAPVMHQSAIELAARKISATGDLRKALDICRKAVEIVEKELDQSSKNMPIETLDKAPTINVKHVLQAASSMLGSPIIFRIRALQMQPKLLLCCIVLMQRVKKATSIQSVSQSKFRYMKAFYH
jgi:cell division control protein 6